MVSLDPVSGHEQAGHRPVLVVSPDVFNAVTRIPVILPITNGGGFVKRIAFAVELVGTQTTGVIRCDQPRALDMGSRRARLVESVPQAILDDVLAKVVTLFE